MVYMPTSRHCEEAQATTSSGPPRHESHGKNRKHLFAVLIRADVAGLYEAPSGPRGRRPLRHELADEADGVAGEHRLDPAQIAEARRGPPHRHLLAACKRFLGPAFDVGHEELHADRGDMPAGGGEPAEQRLLALL